jgi:hypothetical protein
MRALGRTCDQAVSRERMPDRSAGGDEVSVEMTTLEARVIVLEELCRGLSTRLDALDATFKAYGWPIDPLKRQEPAEQESGGEADLS